MRAHAAIRSLTLAGLSAGATEMLVLTLVARQQAIDPSGAYASGIFVAALAGTSAMGLFGRRLLAHFLPAWLGVGVPALCFGLVCAAVLLGSGIWDFAIVGLVAFVSALELPNLNSTVSRLVSARHRSTAFSTLQSASNLIMIVAPLFAASLISLGGDKFALSVVGLAYLVSAIPWLWIPPLRPHAKPAAGQSSPYQLIFRAPALRGLTFCRLLSNLVYSGLPIALPYLLSKVAENHDHFLWMQSASISSLRGGLLLASLAGIVIFARKPTWVVPLSALSPVAASVLAGVITIAMPSSVLFLCCLLIGAAQFGSRLTGLVLGPSVTPVNRLAEVVLASDTVVRLGSALYGGVLMSVMAYASGSAMPFAIAAVGSLAAPAFLRPAFLSYQRQLRSNENAI